MPKRKLKTRQEDLLGVECQSIEGQQGARTHAHTVICLFTSRDNLAFEQWKTLGKTGTIIKPVKKQVKTFGNKQVELFGKNR